MFKIKVLKREDIENILNIKDAIEAVEKAYIAKVRNEAEVFPTIFHEFKPGKADMDIKAGYLMGSNVYGFKLVSWFDENPKKGLPALIGLMMVLEGDTGKPLGLLDASFITSIRTGAAGSIGIKYLARKDSKNILIVGSGNQAVFQLAASLSVLDNVQKVSVYNPLFPDEAIEFVKSIKDTFMNDFLVKFDKDSIYYDKIKKRYDVQFEVVKNIEETTKEADIIITATPSRIPMIKKEWINHGTHINCIGADMEGKQEIDENIFGIARVFVDDINQSVAVGETETAIKKGVIDKEDIVGEIGDVIEGNIRGRLSYEDITLFDTSGLAIQDLITAKYALKAAEEKGLGAEVEI